MSKRERILLSIFFGILLVILTIFPFYGIYAYIQETKKWPIQEAVITDASVITEEINRENYQCLSVHVHFNGEGWSHVSRIEIPSQCESPLSKIDHYVVGENIKIYVNPANKDIVRDTTNFYKFLPSFEVKIIFIIVLLFIYLFYKRFSRK